jgi:Protein of unknown function (DUF1573)
MRIVTVIVSSAIVGTTIGAALAYVDVWPGDVRPRPAHTTESPQAPGPSEPRVQVDSPHFDFGTMQRGTTKSHEFEFRNVGHGPLTLRVGNTSCKCTLGSVPDEPIPPGGSVNVKLEWTAKINAGPFRQTASVITNDSTQSRVDLQVDGKVTEASGLFPPDFMFDKLTAGETKSAEVFVMSFDNDEPLTVGEPVLFNQETRKYFDVHVEPVERSVLPNPDAKQGVKITVTAKPGLPLGRFDQWLKLPSNIKDASTLEIPIIGRVVGNISIHGRLYSEDQGVLRLGTVKSDEGASAKLNIVIRGDDAAATTLSVETTDPPELKAELGEPNHLSSTLVHVPLTVEVPRGTPPMAHLDTQQGEAGKITLKTNSKEAAQVVIHVRFDVER